MSYGVVVTVQAPVEVYDKLHHELREVTRGGVPGLLLHLGRSAADGFQVIEVWDSREQSDHYNREVVWPLAQRVLGDDAPRQEPAVEEFEVRGLIIPDAGIAY